MYSKIIQLTPKRIPKEAYVTVFDLTDDICLKTHSNYAGCEHNYDDVIDEIATELRPIAFVNKARRTITFKKENTISKWILKNILLMYRDTKRSFRLAPVIPTRGYRSHEAIRAAIDTVGVSDYLFYYGTEDTKCHTLSEMLFDHINGDLPKTLRIGGILDYQSNQ